MTNDDVAEALGYKICTIDCIDWTCEVYMPDGSVKQLVINDRLPLFTTSIDAIVKEIERRGLYFSFMKNVNDDTYQAIVFGVSSKDENHIAGLKEDSHPTAPLALCYALIAYLKGK